MVKEQEPLLAGLSFRQIEEQYYFPYNCGGSNLFLREVWGIRRLMPIENGMTKTPHSLDWFLGDFEWLESGAVPPR